MNYSVIFQRGARCPHDVHRECAPCFKGGMREVWSALTEEDFDEMWKAQHFSRTKEDLMDAFQCFFTMDEPPGSLAFIDGVRP